MTSLAALNRYLSRFRWQLRAFAGARGFAFTAALALLLTLLFASIGNHYEFAPRVVGPLRWTLFATLAFSVALAVALPLWKLRGRRATAAVEAQVPEFQQRLLTIEEQRKAGPDSWTELLAEETLTKAQQVEPVRVRALRFLTLAAAATLLLVGVLSWLVRSGPGYMGYGAALLWTGNANEAKRPLYAIQVEPGNRTVRRRSNQAITAQLEGFSADAVILHARYGNATHFETVRMEPARDPRAYRFVFAAINEPIEYWVEASHSQTRHFTVSVRDLPNLRHLRVVVHYPKELRLTDVVNDGAGDIRAVKGSLADVHIETDRPLADGVLVLANGRKLKLTPEEVEANRYVGHVPVEEDGAYHLAAIDEGEVIRMSDDWFIEAQKDEPPVVKISRPGTDPHVSPIEELPVTVSASDDFGVNGLELRYAVNGGPERSVNLLKRSGKQAEEKTMVAFEDLKASPGDLVSLYAVARDAHTSARSEMVFAQADAFDYKFSQGQQAGGGEGGGGNESNDITQKQKQIIAATFNQMKSDKKGSSLLDDGKFLAGEQSKLSEQAKTLAERMNSRELGTSGSEFERFAKLMTEASGEMAAASGELQPARWNDALAPEQKALASLLRAGAIFRDIQVTMARQGGGGGGASNAGRDLARMSDLELDTAKNQYETGSSATAESGAERQKALDQARQRLEALARRQQELNAAQNLAKSGFEQRWQEEQLRRDAEQLRRELQQMAKDDSAQKQGQTQAGQSQQGQSQQGQTSQASSSQPEGQLSPGSQAGQPSRQNGQQQAQGRPSGQPQAGQQQASNQSSTGGPGQQNQLSGQAFAQASQAIEKAEEEMRRAVSSGDRSAAARAAQQLAEAQRAVDHALRQQAGGTVSDLAARAERMARQQSELAGRMHQLYGNRGEGMTAREDRLRRYAMGANGGSGDPRSGDSSTDALPEMNDPAMRYGMRRRMYAGFNPPIANRPTSADERAIADQKDRLAKEIEALQGQMQQQAQAIAGAKPGSSAKLMRALSDVESKELALRMGKNAEWMRQGYGDRNLGMEDGVTQSLQQLGRALRDVETSLAQPDAADERARASAAAQAGTRTARPEDAPEAYREAVAGYFKRLSSAK